jgi:hypothetical protein
MKRSIQAAQDPQRPEIQQPTQQLQPQQPRLTALETPTNATRFILLPATIAGAAATALVDTGSTGTFLSQTFAQRHGISVVKTPDYSAILADGTTAPIAGHTADLSLTIQDHRTSRTHHSKTKLLILPHLDGMDIVLGMDWLQSTTQKSGPARDSSSSRLQKTPLLSAPADISPRPPANKARW